MCVYVSYLFTILIAPSNYRDAPAIRTTGGGPTIINSPLFVCYRFN